MEEQEYKKTYKAVNDLPCPFEKAILTRRFGCEHCIKLNIAEREAVGCRSHTAHMDCLALLDMLRHNAMFALKLTHIVGKLPHAKEMRVQCGGLLGLRNTVLPELADEPGVQNIFAVVTAAQTRPGGFDDLPFQEIVKSIAAFEARPKRSGPRRL
jgi:hypothetical protein